MRTLRSVAPCARRDWLLASGTTNAGLWIIERPYVCLAKWGKVPLEGGVLTCIDCQFTTVQVMETQLSLLATQTAAL